MLILWKTLILWIFPSSTQSALRNFANLHFDFWQKFCEIKFCYDFQIKWVSRNVWVMLFFYPYYMYLSCRTKNFVKSIYIETSLRRKKVDFTEFLSKCSAQSGNAQVWQSLKFTLNEVFFRVINSLASNFHEIFCKKVRE